MRLALGLATLSIIGIFVGTATAQTSSSLAGHQRLADPGLKLNEFLAGPARDWDGSGSFSSRDDEWVEVRNTSSAVIDLTGYILTDGDSIPRYAFIGNLASGQRILVYGKDSYAWERANGYPAFGLSLSNSGDQVLLWQIVGTDTMLVDSYAYRSHEAAADRAVGRLDDTGPWNLFDGLNPYTGTTPPQGNGCNPSPGSVNACSTGSKNVTWGRLKTVYR